MEPSSRRSFLGCAAGLAAQASPAARAAGQPTPAVLPKVKFGNTEITRLIIGSNPFYGYSHFNRILDQTMRDWYTQDRRIEVLHDCERHGINTWQVHYDAQLAEDFKRYRAEGGRMHMVLLASPDLVSKPNLLTDAAKL